MLKKKKPSSNLSPNRLSKPEAVQPRWREKLLRGNQPQKSRDLQKQQSSAPVFSYYASRSPGTNSRQTAGSQTASNQKKRWLIWLPSGLAVIVIVVCCLYATSLDSQPKVHIVAKSDTLLLRDNAFYQKVSANLMGGSVFNRNKLTIDTAKLAQKIESSYPELGKVSVVIPLSSRRPIINAQPAAPLLRLMSNSGNFIIDEEGRALIKSEDVPSSLLGKLPQINDESGLDVSVNKQVLPQATIRFLEELIAQLGVKHVPIHTMTLPAIANELHLQAEGDGYYVKFDIQGSARQQAGTFLAARERLKADGTTPNEYIDVRIPEKAFYK